jgi:membrane protease YdiL (CAAX protease family)
MNLLDHLVMMVLVAGLPLYAARTVPGEKAKIAAGEPDARIRMYWESCRMQWVLTTVLLVGWWYAKRPWTELGFSIQPTPGFWIVLAVVVGFCVVMVVYYAAAARTPESRAKSRAAFGQTAILLPHEHRELRPFLVLSVTAGVCEEVLYRGFLIWYVAQFTGTTAFGTVAAVAISSIAFGAGHLYQGPASAARIAGFAAAAGTIYVVGGSLWIVMVLHVCLDIAGGFLAVALFRDDDSTTGR